MLDLYKGIKIEDKVIIVEKQNTDRQGYLVSVNNPKQLETALNWAETYGYDESLREKYLEVEKTDTKAADEIWKQYLATKKELKGIIHEYENGQFKLTLCESAERSWRQSGKLSFWNCLLTCPDGNTFLVGINSECLLSLLKSADFIKGVCQSNLWLGRIKNNVGAFTEDMDEFKDGKKDQAMRDAKPTNKYEKGQVLNTKTAAYCYLGELYKQFSIYRNDGHGYAGGNKYPEFFMNVYSKPKKVYAYDQISTYSGKIKTEEDVNADYLTEYYFTNAKKKALLADEKYNIDIDKMIDNTVKNYNRESKDYYDMWNSGTCDPDRSLRGHGHNEYKCPEGLKQGSVFKVGYITEEELIGKKGKLQAERLTALIKLFEERGGKVVYDYDIPKEDISWRSGLSELF